MSPLEGAPLNRIIRVPMIEPTISIAIADGVAQRRQHTFRGGVIVESQMARCGGLDERSHRRIDIYSRLSDRKNRPRDQCTPRRLALIAKQQLAKGIMKKKHNWLR